MYKPYPKDSTGLEVPNLQVIAVSKLTEDDGGVTSSVYKSTFQIDLQTDEVAQYVWLEAIGNFFSSLQSVPEIVTVGVGHKPLFVTELATPKN